MIELIFKLVILGGLVFTAGVYLYLVAVFILAAL